MTSYSTSPPWAPSSALPAGPAPQHYTPHGGLLVPYPEEMHNAGRPRPPAVWPVALFTLLFGLFGPFGLFGAIPAARRAARARRGRTSTAPYWITFGIALAAGAFLSFVLTLTVVKPIITSVHEASAVGSLQQNLVKDGELERTAGMQATSAACTAVDIRGTDGQRIYSCILKLSDGKTGTIDVTAGRDGTWQPVN